MKTTKYENMESITKAVFSNKLNSVTDSVTKNLNLGDDKDEEKDNKHLTSKELRKLDEEAKAERAKRDEIHTKRADERQKKREAMRAKYGIEKTAEKEGGKRRPSQGKEDQTESNEEKSCSVM